MKTIQKSLLVAAVLGSSFASVAALADGEITFKVTGDNQYFHCKLKSQTPPLDPKSPIHFQTHEIDARGFCKPPRGQLTTTWQVVQESYFAVRDDRKNPFRKAGSMTFTAPSQVECVIGSDPSRKPYAPGDSFCSLEFIDGKPTVQCGK